MTASPKIWWRNHPKEEQIYSTTASAGNSDERVTNHYLNTNVYHYGKRKPPKTNHSSSLVALTFTTTILLLLTVFRQTFDFLSELWLQILINFFSILIIIVALFGVRQNRISYLALFIVWALFNTLWNLVVISIHVKVRNINISEDILSLHTGGISWWHANGPGCLPYRLSTPIHQSVSILARPSIITGCRFDYHLVESVQAAIHSCLSLISLLLCCYVAFKLRMDPCHLAAKKDKTYRMKDLTKGHSVVNHDPYPGNDTSRFLSGPSTLKRAANKVSSRSSQNSMASARSERRRQRHLSGTERVGTLSDSTSLAHRSQKYGSLSSRRSSSKRRNWSEKISTTTNPRIGHRTRQSSVSSTDYLPSYQPPHSSSVNLLSSYGEISSIDSFNNPSSGRGQPGQKKHRLKDRGNTNPVYSSSRTSVCSQNINPSNNYDDISNAYRVQNNGGVYCASDYT